MASRADSARIVLRWLRDRKPVMLGADMDYGMRNSTFVPFFGVHDLHADRGRPARQDRACAGRAVHRRGAAELQGLPAARYSSPGTTTRPATTTADARRMNAFLEEQIRLMPEQYYWVHKRFKTRPPGEPGLY